MIISVVMATCNGAKYLAEQLATLAAQSRLPDELIVSDDASTDTTLQILHAFQASASFPVTIRLNEKRLGYSRNFANAVQRASGEIILFCDQDDYWEDQKIESVAGWFDTHPDKALALHNISVCDERLNISIGNYFEHLDLNHAKHSFIKGCATAIRRELAEAAFPFPEFSNWRYDNRIHAIARARGDFGYIDRVLVKHRIHAAQSSGFIITPKGPGGRFLAALDERAIESSPPWARALRLLPRPHTECALRELLEASDKTNLAPIVVPAVPRIQKRDSFIASQEGTKFSRIARLLYFYVSGGYRSIGGISQYLADAIRLAKA